ncbi:MAG: membrane dipeptidase [Bacteroidales bacterium]|nr:membrane dipeptidase [Bacteroidales bacterium]
MPKRLFIDIHCHPSLKPYGHSYSGNKNSKKVRKKRSIWHRKQPGTFTEKLNEYTTLTHFTQSDFQTLCEGNARVIFASLSPLEKGFFVSKLGKGPVTDIAAQMALGIGLRKINFVQKNTDYFSELENEMAFLMQLHAKPIKIDGVLKEYRLVKSYTEIVANLSESENIISVVPAIEGAHSFMEDNSHDPDPAMVLDTIDKMLDWEYKPLFISLTHHFYNYLCGHAYSLPKVLLNLLDQEDHVNTDFTELGNEVVRKLLANGILIDIKHMSRKSRRTYYAILEEEAYREIPVIVSHGSVNGHTTVYTDIVHEADNGLFYGSDINFYDDELVKVSKSKGLFGLQLDERRIASEKELDKISHRLPDEVRHERYAMLLWNQMLHIARTLDHVNENAWDCMCIGSDYDGIVNPMDGFWTVAEYELLFEYVLQHARNYLVTHPNSFDKPSNNLEAEEIIEKVTSGNVMQFLARHYA